MITIVLDQVNKGGAFLVGLGTAALLLLLLYLLRKFLHDAPKLLSAVLYSHMHGWSQRVAVGVSALSLLWVLLLLGAVYSPIAAFAPETMPTARGEARALLAVNIWIVALAIPVVFGAFEAISGGARGWKAISMVPAGMVHLAGLGLALLLLTPWLVARRISALVLRRSRETYSCEVELDRYEEVLEVWQRRLIAMDLDSTVTRASNVVQIARWLVNRAGPPAFRAPVEHSVAQIVAPGLHLVLLESLVEVTGRRDAIALARSALLNSLPPAGLWWTRSKEARDLEAQILHRREGLQPDVIRRRLAEVEVSSYEWNTLHREYLLMEIGT